MIERANVRRFSLLLAVLAVGCGAAEGYKPQPMGWGGSISVFRACDMTWQEHAWVLGATNTHYQAYSIGYTAQAAQDVEMRFAGLAQPTMLIRQGQLVRKPGFSMPSGPRCSAVVYRSPVRGSNPMGPAISYKALRHDENGDPAAMIQLDAKCTMHGLYSTLVYAFHADAAPNPAVSLEDYHRWWADVFEIDRRISENLRRAR